MQHLLHLCLHNHLFKKGAMPWANSNYYFYKATCVILREKLDSEIIFTYGVKGYFSKNVFNVKYPLQRSFNLETKPIGQKINSFLL